MIRLLPLLLLFTGCVRDLDKSALGEPAREIFRDFDIDPAALVGTLEAMDAAMDKLELEDKVRKRLYDVPELTAEYFADVAVPKGIDTKDQMRAGMVALSSHSVHDNLRAQVEENMTCINAKSVTCHERVGADDDGDAQCFLDGDCEVYRTENTIRIESVIDFWIQAPVDFRWVALSDGRQAAVGRTWMENKYTNDNGKREWRQRFGVDVFIEDPKNDKKTRRFYASWLAPSVNGIPGNFLQPAVRRGLDDGFVNPDEWLDDEQCDVKLSECLADSPF